MLLLSAELQAVCYCQQPHQGLVHGLNNAEHTDYVLRPQPSQAALCLSNGLHVVATKMLLCKPLQ